MRLSTVRYTDLRVEYQSTESTGFPYLFCHGCGTVHRTALLIEGTMSIGYLESTRWMRLCADCVDKIIQAGKENQRAQ